ncbi:signal recognition particle protein [candidate division NPL-UPA2 bacterium]|nr:signal recognition particle protein [candidate division NPL-UPA2 bacterium]
MFENISVRLGTIFKKLRGRGKLTPKNIEESLKEVRLALLEADVNYKVVKRFIDEVGEKAVGEAVLRNLTPGQQVIKVIHEELTRVMGPENSPINMASSPPTIIILVGLQGGGKTTSCAKLGGYLKREGYNPLLVATDIQRPAAREQLETLGKELSIPIFSAGRDPLNICEGAKALAASRGWDVLLVDTAGRLHIDEKLMKELRQLKKVLQPQETLLVADAMTGQDAVNIARTFEETLGLEGVILTKLDGDARGGAALSIKAVTQKPIKFIGLGEKLDAFEPFRPGRIASRILGMGDVLTLVEKAEKLVSEEETRRLERKLLKDTFTFEDFLLQLERVKKLGSLQDILELVPGLSLPPEMPSLDDHQIGRIEAMIRSMTREERRNPRIIDGSRRRRIARGSGTTLMEVNRLLKQFTQMKRMMKEMGKMGKGWGGRFQELQMTGN